MTVKLSSDGYAIVNDQWVLFPADQFPPPPKGLMICANVNSGKTTISTWNDQFGFTHWAGLPVFPKG